MKKITYFIIAFILLVYINACAGYKPIFGSTKLQFKIADYSIKPNKKLGNQIYSQLYKLSKSNKNSAEAQSLHITIQVTKNKNATIKNSTGKIMEYRISLNTNIIVNDFLTGDEILNQNFTYNSSYKVQNQQAETLQLENKTTENLLNKTYTDFLIKMSENMLSK